METAKAYRRLVHRLFSGDPEVSAAVLRRAGLPPVSERQPPRKRSTQQVIDFGAGAGGPARAQGADDGARARQPQ